MEIRKAKQVHKKSGKRGSQPPKQDPVLIPREHQNPASTATSRASVVSASLFRAPEYKHPTYRTSSPNSIFTVYSPLRPTLPRATAATARPGSPDWSIHTPHGSVSSRKSHRTIPSRPSGQVRRPRLLSGDPVLPLKQITPVQLRSNLFYVWFSKHFEKGRIEGVSGIVQSGDRTRAIVTFSGRACVWHLYVTKVFSFGGEDVSKDVEFTVAATDGSDALLYGEEITLTATRFSTLSRSSPRKERRVMELLTKTSSNEEFILNKAEGINWTHTKGQVVIKCIYDVAKMNKDPAGDDVKLKTTLEVDSLKWEGVEFIIFGIFNVF
ncbi:hypothetical protein BLNAU_12098 [Blattamonas nauphoetae]|uniref:Uncharacterized protein n=1 Tax=Blattamonas nauphoetae TaxID=2049346 RepID=A0ABQ9XNF7_9EUKA|nr:hypothetical protein BLNAU_12098 [Blattamonas nauphoetae]